MDPQLEEPATSDAQNHGLQFINEDWNESISNGQPFTLRWNKSLEGIEADLGVFKVGYPQDGVALYELVSNLSSSIDVAQCVWTPHDLTDELYALWLNTKGQVHPSWTLSPPWRPTEPGSGSDEFHWAAPVAIPISVIMVLYALGVFTCLMYRRRRKRARQRAAATAPEEAQLRQGPDGRHGSVDSEASQATTVTLMGHEDGPGGRKASGQSAMGTTKLDPAWLTIDTSVVEVRRPSDGTTSTGTTYRASEDTVVAVDAPPIQVHLQPEPPPPVEEARRERQKGVRRGTR